MPKVKTPTLPAFAAAASPNVFTLSFDDVRAGWEQWILLRSDAHHDSALCDQAYEQEQLDEAVRRNALILDGGDLFDAMQGPGDRRARREELRNPHNVSPYFDRLVSTAADFYAPYSDRLLMLARGNHETAVTQHYATDLTDRLAAALRGRGGATLAAGYGGWVMFKFRIRQTVQTTVRLKYFHGAGGGGPVTRGVIQTARQAVYLPDAEIVWNGHVHEGYHVAIARERLTKEGKVYRDIQHHVRTSTYKDDYNDGAAGWAVGKGMPPKPIGAAWLRFWLPSGGESIARVESEIVLAVR